MDAEHSCPDAADLFDYFEGRLSAAEERRIAQHVARGCEACNEELVVLRWGAAAAGAHLAPPPIHVEARARSIPAQWNAAGRDPSAAAAAAPEPTYLEALAGVRDPVALEPRVLWSGDGLEVELAVAVTGEEEVSISGQILVLAGDLKQAAGLEIRLCQGDRTTARARSDEHGQFVIEGRFQGLHSLHLRRRDGSDVAIPLSV